MLGYETLSNHYISNFNMMFDYKMSLSELENMMPWERLIYTNMINNRMKIEEDRRNNQADMQRHVAKQRK